METKPPVGPDPRVLAYIRAYGDKFSEEQIKARLTSDAIAPQAIDAAYAAVRQERELAARAATFQGSGEALLGVQRTPMILPPPRANTEAPKSASTLFSEKPELVHSTDISLARPVTKTTTVTQATKGWNMKKAFALGGLVAVFAGVGAFEAMRGRGKTLSVEDSQGLRDAPAAVAAGTAASSITRKAMPDLASERARYERAQNLRTFARMAYDASRRNAHEDVLRNVDEALKYHDAGLNGAETRDSLLKMRARSNASMGRTSEALKDLDRILAEAPGSADVHYEKARLLYEADDLEGSISSAEAAVAADPSSPAGYALQAAAYGRKGELRTALGRYGEAIDRIDADERFKEDPAQQANLYYNRGAILTELGLHDDAFTDIKNAARLAPEESLYQRAIDQLARAMGKKAPAAARPTKKSRTSASLGLPSSSVR